MSSRLDETFVRLRAADELGLFPYLTAGYPDPWTCDRLLDTICAAGADGLEIGIPFSDPLADGVTIQRASARALDHGVTLADALGMVRRLRVNHDVPVVFMSYINPLLAFGFEAFCQAGSAVGVDGVIVPDAPIEESPALRAACETHGLSYVYMAAPTTGSERLREIGAHASGYVYCVSLIGTTGARAGQSAELPAFLERARSAIRTPLVVGFGIATSDQIGALVGQVEGAIVGSALTDLIERTPTERVEAAVASFIGELKAATRSSVGQPR